MASDRMDKAISEIFVELRRAEEKHPGYPQDNIHRAAILGEEAGEVLRAAVQLRYECGDRATLRKEIVHTAAMAYRFLFALAMDEEAING